MPYTPLEYDKPTKISPLVTRVLSDNSSFMTGPGTNTYLIGHHDIAVIDPGPFDPYHIEAIIKAAQPPTKIKWILVTHTHPDHSPGASLLKEKTGAPVLGLTASGKIYWDDGDAPEQLLKPDGRIQTSEFCLRVIHTPGHAANHACFLLENENLLFTGDHIMQGSTVVIIPPSGNMRDYLTSLENLRNYQIEKLAPGHGYIIDDPFGEVDDIIQHRLEREAKVLSALKRAGRASINQLLPEVYDDVPFFKHGVAAYSLEAHLIKLEEEHRVSRDRSVWSFNSDTL